MQPAAAECLRLTAHRIALHASLLACLPAVDVSASTLESNNTNLLLTMSPTVAIPKRKLGKTGLEVTVLGMGGAPLGGLFQVCVVYPASHALVLSTIGGCCTCSYVAG